MNWLALLVVSASAAAELSPVEERLLNEAEMLVRNARSDAVDIRKFRKLLSEFSAAEKVPSGDKPNEVGVRAAAITFVSRACRQNGKAGPALGNILVRNTTDPKGWEYAIELTGVEDKMATCLDKAGRSGEETSRVFRWRARGAKSGALLTWDWARQTKPEAIALERIPDGMKEPWLSRLMVARKTIARDRLLERKAEWLAEKRRWDFLVKISTSPKI